MFLSLIVVRKPRPANTAWAYFSPDFPLVVLLFFILPEHAPGEESLIKIHCDTVQAHIYLITINQHSLPPPCSLHWEAYTWKLQNMVEKDHVFCGCFLWYKQQQPEPSIAALACSYFIGPLRELFPSISKQANLFSMDPKISEFCC